MLGAFAAMALGSFLATDPAHAMNTSANCHVVTRGNPPTTDYPANWFISCPRTYPVGSDDANAVSQNEVAIFDNIRGKPHAPAGLHVRDFLSNSHVTFYFFSYEEDAYDTLGITVGNGLGQGPALDDKHSALTFVLAGAGSPAQVYPITIVWNHWGPGKPRQIYNLQPKSINHEIGHQLDRQWAVARGLTPANTATITSADAKWLKAIGYDLADLTASEITTMGNWPRLRNDNNQVLTTEVFAELFAFKSGGGVDGSEAIFLHQAFPCATWVMDKLYAGNGDPVSAPNQPYLNPSVCYGHSN